MKKIFDFIFNNKDYADLLIVGIVFAALYFIPHVMVWVFVAAMIWLVVLIIRVCLYD